MTEHMPRDLDEDLYPEEASHGYSCARLFEIFDAYYREAVRLREKYSSQIHLLIGFEIDWIRPSSQHLIEGLMSKYQFDLFVGSVHHVYTIPIDYDGIMYAKARERSGAKDTDEQLFCDYFDTQYEMLKALKPPIIGHFDLIRLKSDDSERSFKTWDSVWKKILRNLDFTAGYGGMIELNSAAVRKGMKEPYPKGEICEVFLEKGGRFVMSDDSHGVDQIAWGYHRVLDFVDSFGVTSLSYLEKGHGAKDIDERFQGVYRQDVPVDDLRKEACWTLAPL